MIRGAQASPWRTWPTWKGTGARALRRQSVCPRRAAVPDRAPGPRGPGHADGRRTGRRVHLVECQRAGAFHRDREGRRPAMGGTAEGMDMGAARGGRGLGPAGPAGRQRAIVLLPDIQRAQLAASASCWPATRLEGPRLLPEAGSPAWRKAASTNPIWHALWRNEPYAPTQCACQSAHGKFTRPGAGSARRLVT